jgi:hypothetical protein
VTSTGHPGPLRRASLPATSSDHPWPILTGRSANLMTNSRFHTQSRFAGYSGGVARLTVLCVAAARTLPASADVQPVHRRSVLHSSQSPASAWLQLCALTDEFKPRRSAHFSGGMVMRLRRVLSFSIELGEWCVDTAWVPAVFVDAPRKVLSLVEVGPLASPQQLVLHRHS